MTHYTEDNTEGYTAGELAMLNARYEQAIETLNPDGPHYQDCCQAVSESILREHDSGK